MSYEEMREMIRGVYHTESWNEKVDRMQDEQVVAVYLKFKSEGKFDTYSEGAKPKEKKQKVGVLFKGESLIDLGKCKERWMATLREFCIRMTDEEIEYFNGLETREEAQAFYRKMIRERL